MHLVVCCLAGDPLSYISFWLEDFVYRIQRLLRNVQHSYRFTVVWSKLDRTTVCPGSGSICCCQSPFSSADFESPVPKEIAEKAMTVASIAIWAKLVKSFESSWRVHGHIVHSARRGSPMHQRLAHYLSTGGYWESWYVL